MRNPRLQGTPPICSALTVIRSKAIVHNAILLTQPYVKEASYHIPEVRGGPLDSQLELRSSLRLPTAWCRCAAGATDGPGRSRGAAADVARSTPKRLYALARRTAAMLAGQLPSQT
jgi:hypothetical protein